jgi:predicted RNase H-like HicB family nuclease
MSFWRKNGDTETAVVKIPILCKFWREDDVWNGTAEHLAVAAFGDTFEEAEKNLHEAVVAHIDCWVEAGKAAEIFALLREQAREQLNMEEICPDTPLVKMQVGMQDDRLVALTV